MRRGVRRAPDGEVRGTVAQPDMDLGYGERPAEEDALDTGLSPVQNGGRGLSL